MAVRNIRQLGDSILAKKCREIKEITPRIRELINDMKDTMYDANGVGLAAPQVGVLKCVVVIDVGDGPIVLINPRMLESNGEQTGEEGCLSVPGKYGIERIVVEGEELLARAICHEMEHLEGHTYVEKVEDGLHDVEEEA